MKKEIKTQDGMITEEVFAAPGLTVSHERKVSDGNYGTTSYGCFYQLDLPVEATEQDKAAALVQGFAIVRQAVDAAFATDQAPQTMTEARIIEDLGAEIIKEQPKKAPYKKTYPKREGAEPADKTNFWQELVDNPNKWFINNEKPTAKYPDFKRKGTGEALWLSDAPAELVGRAKALLG